MMINIIYVNEIIHISKDNNDENEYQYIGIYNNENSDYIHNINDDNNGIDEYLIESNLNNNNKDYIINNINNNILKSYNDSNSLFINEYCNIYNSQK